MWKYNKKLIKCKEDLPEDCIGFVYEIVNISAQKRNQELLDLGFGPERTEATIYIGKKLLSFSKRVKTTKKDKETSKKKTKIITSDSGWLGYTGSNYNLNWQIQEGDKIKKTILYCCKSKAELSYKESKEIFLRGCLETNTYYNAWISVRCRKANLKNI